ncbi:MAG: ABC transporter ATP-binding protein, partial [Bacteroidaceae bacterium]|nr:ABC transporter ATP-binding protein [Bacteroidaceae bacterium]
MRFNKTKYPTRTILRWLWSHHKGCRTQAITNVVVGLLQVGLGLWGVEQLRQLTDVATGKQEGHLLWMVALYVVIMLAEFLCHISRTWLAAVLGVRTQNMMQRQFFERILKGKWSGIERFHSGDVLNRLFGDVNDIVNLMSEVLPFLVTIIVQFIASFVYLLLMDSTLAIIIVISCPIFLLLSKLYFRKMRRIVRKLKDSNSDLQSTIQESIQHKMVIKVMEMADRMVSRLARRQQLLQWQTQQRARLSILTRTIVFIGFRGAAIAALAYGLVQVQNNVITVGMLMAFTQLVWRIQHPLLDLGRLLPTLVNSFASSERLMELEELPVEQAAAHGTSGTLGTSSFPLKGVRGSKG